MYMLLFQTSINAMMRMVAVTKLVSTHLDCIYVHVTTVMCWLEINITVKVEFLYCAKY